MSHTTTYVSSMPYRNIQDNSYPLVTVAMAVYNAMPFLPWAIENILNQSYKHIDFLIVDDGSTDTSKEVIREYAQKYKNIRYISRIENEGLSAIRNISISEAQGEYLLMIDADDLMELETIAKAVAKAMENDADIVIWDYDTFYSSSKELPEIVKSSHLSKFNVSNRHELLQLPAFMPVRLMKTGYVRSRHISFPHGLTKQDIPVHWATMTDPDSHVSLLPEVLFHYRQHGATTTNRKGSSLFALAKVMDIVGNELHSSNLYDKYKSEFLSSRLSLLHGMYDFILPQFKEQALQMIRERFDDEAKQFIINNPDKLGKRVRWFYGKLQGSTVDKIAYDTIMGIRKIYRVIKIK